MGTLNDIFGAGGVASLVGKLADKIWPDPNERAKNSIALLEAQQRGEFKLIDAELQQMQMQADINKVEAGSASVFVAGWRPFIGWTCGSALAWTFVVQPFVISFAVLAGLHFDVAALPTLNTGELMVPLLGMLGLGGMRTYEKFKGVEGNR